MKSQVFIDVDAGIKWYSVFIFQKVCLIMKVLAMADFFRYVFCDFQWRIELAQDWARFYCYFRWHFSCFILIDFLMTKIADYFLLQFF